MAVHNFHSWKDVNMQFGTLKGNRRCFIL